MAPPVFKRGLSEQFVKRLNEMYQAGGWWRALVEDKDLFIAIRDDYINVYFKGCSVLKLSWLHGKREIAREIHYKYLLKPSIEGSLYIGFGKFGPNLPPDLRSMFLDDFNDVGELKSAVIPYADAEKKGVHDIVMKNPTVVDLEIAISDGKSARRIDLAAVHEDPDRPGTVKLVFYEVKHFPNKELRSSSEPIPVVKQMDRYSELIKKHHNELLKSYRKVCCNLSELEGVGRQNSRRHTILRDTVRGSMELLIDCQPRLIVFGFDKDQRKGEIWKKHFKKLKQELGKERILCAGNAGDIRLDGR